MTDTDLITAADSGSAPSEAVNSTNAAPSAGASRSRSGSLTSMLLPDLRALASEVGVKGTSGMRKSDLIAAIREQRGESAGAKAAPAEKAEKAPKAAPVEQPTLDSAPDQSAAADAGQGGDAPQQSPQRRERRSAGRQSGAPDNRQDGDAGEAKDTTDKGGETDNAKSGGNQQGNRNENANRSENANRDNANRNDNSGRNENSNRNDRNDSGGNNQNANNQNANNQNNADDDDGRGGRRGRRFRDRRRRGERSGGGEGGGQGGGGGERDTELREDDVVQPVAGILDVLDNYAFVRTSGYLAGPNDVYVSMNMVRKNGLRRGDAVTGAVRVAREGESSGGGNNPRQKFNPLVRLDTVNGGPVENAKNRPDFTKLTPLYPNQRLRLETTPDRLTTRVIDLIMPIGKGQRALIVSPPKAGKTTIMQDIANAITTNNPECHLMVVLVDERPEEVTDMTRSVKGEVIASTFDRPPSDHTQAAELAIERAKRLVEQGKDVVVLLDSITRLGRAYNNASPASGRILSGGVDSTALYPPKRFLGAARNIEHGGSLTIIATAMVETGSTGDTVIFEEFKGTGNAELKLDRKIAERRVFPAVDVNPSGTRKDELLLGADEFAVVHKLRRVLSGLDSHQAIDLLMSQLRKTKTNYEFLVQVSKTTPGGMDND
ncbi:transcription termination factor Rho [Mycolicibacterium neoaurum]|uniref:transcription termination factor Rho n=1 Tax=Mycolicibacterium neoaurum TaxID=1795 RepID=UPI00248C4C26|nr:transcription termination factor Rho [Mycolicibacterium neoaurum]WBP94654.1 transcription termination factor Rho [Mycolicibacterium neoaurum]WBS09045.1 transcription termination factor Rho [Mycolicibacterium neoaurum]